MRQTERTWTLFLAAALFVTASFSVTRRLSAAESGPAVSIVSDTTAGPAARHGLQKLTLALRDKGVHLEEVNLRIKAKGRIQIVAGLPDGPGEAAKLLEATNTPAPDGAESLLVRNIRFKGRKILLVTGADDRGLMYALLDIADRIGWAANPENPLSEVGDIVETAAVPERALTKFVMNKSEFERYCFSEEYWAGYLDMLAANRFNTFHLLFGYFTHGYFEPIYPYLFDVEGFEDVRVSGLTADEQQRNLRMIKRIIEMTHERGLDFTLGLWTHIHRSDKPEEGVPFGVTDDNLIAYTEVALAKFLKLVPDIDAIQFRVHTEAALNLPQQAEFWKRVFTVIKQSGRDIRVDMRAKGFTDDMIDVVMATGVRMRVTTKYWGEQMGLPFHPTHVKLKNQLRRRHGYADLLQYPRRYKMHWRLWNHGTTRILLWADPDYVRRFAESTLLWDGDGYEVQEPLAMKMSRHRDDETFHLLKSDYRHYKWEYQRYWHFYQVFGRVGYNPNTEPEIWQRDFAERFGSKAAPYIAQAVHRASQVLPRIVAYDLPNLSADITWPEKMRWHDLPTYINNGPIDTAQFVAIEEAARLQIAGIESPKVSPAETSRWFDRAADEIQKLTAQAETRIDDRDNKEFKSTVADLKILAGLARYHARRCESGVNYAAFVYTEDLHCLNEAIRHEARAIEAWEQIVAAADGVYHDYLAFGRKPDLAGHWKDELVRLKSGLADLEETQRSFKPKDRTVVVKFDFGDIATAAGCQPIGRGTRYSNIHGGNGWSHAYTVAAPKNVSGNARKDSDVDFVCGPHPKAYSYSGFMADMPSGHYELTFTMKDSSIEPADYGPMWIVANGMDSTDRFVVPAGKRVEKTLQTTVTDNRLTVAFNSASNGQWLINTMVVARLEPTIGHLPIRKSLPRKPIDIRATVAGPDPIQRVTLFYGSKKNGYISAPMTQSSRLVYAATIPATAVTDGLDYYIQAVDRMGRHTTYPAGGGIERIIVTVTSDNEPPTISHGAIDRWDLAKSLPITANVSDSSGLKWVRLRYRGVNQHQDFRTLEMLPTGKSHEYRAVIPAEHILAQWDLMYFIEAMDNNGNGDIYPDLEKETPYIVVELNR